MKPLWWRYINQAAPKTKRKKKVARQKVVRHKRTDVAIGSPVYCSVSMRGCLLPIMEFVGGHWCCAKHATALKAAEEQLRKENTPEAKAKRAEFEEARRALISMPINFGGVRVIGPC